MTGVINNIATDPAVTVKEITHMNQVLSKCGYLEWDFRKVVQQLDQKAVEPKKSKTTKKDQPVAKTSITIPYIKGWSASLSRVFSAMV